MRKIYPPEGTAILWWNWPWYSTTGCHEEIAAENRHQIRTYQQTGGGTQKKEYAWAICKTPWPTLCRQRAIQPMAKIFYPKKIYRVNNSSHPRTGNFHQIYWKNMSAMLKMIIHVESAVWKKKLSTSSYQVLMVFHQQNTSNAMITSVQEQAITTKYIEKICLQCWRWWYMLNLPCRKRNYPPHHIRFQWSFTNKIPQTPWEGL